MSVHDVPAMQEDWFVREVQRCRALGMPLGCCDCWPECSHVLAWYEAHVAARDTDVPPPPAREPHGGGL